MQMLVVLQVRALEARRLLPMPWAGLVLLPELVLVALRLGALEAWRLLPMHWVGMLVHV